MKRNRWARILAFISVVLTAVVSILLIFLPIYSGASVNPGSQETLSRHATLIQVNGYSVLIVLAIPLLMACVGAVAVHKIRGGERSDRIVSWAISALLIVFVLMSIFSIGAFYAPSALLLLAANILAVPDAESTLEGRP